MTAIQIIQVGDVEWGVEVLWATEIAILLQAGKQKRCGENSVRL